MGRERRHISKGLLLGLRTRRNAKKRAIASALGAARLHSMSPAVNISVHFFTNDAESNNNKLKATKGRKPSGFIGTIEAVKSIAEKEEEEFAQAIGGVSQKYELRPEIVKFAVPNFMKWKSDERACYLQKLQKLLWKSYMPLRILKIWDWYQKA